MGRALRWTALSLLALVAVAGLGGVATLVFSPQTIQLLRVNAVRELEKPAMQREPLTDARPSLLILAMDGMNRDLIYEELNAGRLPGLTALLSGNRTSSSTGSASARTSSSADGKGQFPHAYFEEDLISIVPTASIAAWSSLLTGLPPAHHGASGNEFFIREEKRKAAPIGVSFVDPMLMVSNVTEGYANRQIQAPTIYERMRESEPSLRIWVGLHQIHRGANRLLVARRRLVPRALGTILTHAVTPPFGFEQSWHWFADLDAEVIRNVRAEIDKEGAPDVLTIYTFGTDSIAHRSPMGHDEVRRWYLREVMDPEFAGLKETLVQAGAWDNRYVVLVSDHGLTEVKRVRERALLTDLKVDPPAVLIQSGFRLRPFELEVAPNHDFQSVLTYQGTLGNIYLADRSTCEEPGTPCDWSQPPRFQEDVIVAAEAFHQANRTGARVERMQGSLDLILTRPPMPWNQEQHPFDVYLGGGQTMPLSDYLRDNPRPEYVRIERRLQDLAVGPYGARAGDILLIPNNGNRDDPADRYFFADLFYAWHGGPSRQDAEIPLIVAHPRCTSEQLTTLVQSQLSAEPLLYEVGGLLMRLRQGAPCGD